MKDALWKVDPTGNYSIFDNYYGRETLFQIEPDYGQLVRLIKGEFSGRRIKVDNLLNWILIKTAFRKIGVKQNVFKPMEKNCQLKVVNSLRQRKYTYPNDIKIL
jgi:hypothetical protein